MTFNDTDSLLDLNLDSEAVNTKWSDFRLLHESERGWCDVYSCLLNNRRIVIKTLKQRYRDSNLHQQLLQKEYAIGSMMNHHGIATTFSIENIPGYGLSILMEFVDGTSLDDYIAANPAMSISERITILNRLCEAVSYIHSHQMVHCDLKPSNILITRNGAFVKIIDFGLCRGIGFDMLDISGGTRGFTAPENMQNGSKASPLTDIYSIGKIMQLMDSNAHFKSVWSKCISIDPDKRPGNAADLPELLRQNLAKKKKAKRVATFVGIIILVTGSFLTWRQLRYELAPTFPAQTDNVAKPDVKQIIKSQTVPADSIVIKPDTPDIHKQIPKPEQSEQAETNHSTTTSAIASHRPGNPDSPEFIQQFNSKLEQVVSSRFNEHIAMIDTMTTNRSNMLQRVGHWRWLAKKDMTLWLEERLYPHMSQVNEKMKEVERFILDYEKDPDREYLEWSHRAEAQKRWPEMGWDLTKEAYYETTDLLVVRKFKEDGEWHEERIRVPINRLYPDQIPQIQHEYRQKALRD